MVFKKNTPRFVGGKYYHQLKNPKVYQKKKKKNPKVIRNIIAGKVVSLYVSIYPCVFQISNY